MKDIVVLFILVKTGVNPAGILKKLASTPLVYVAPFVPVNVVPRRLILIAVATPPVLATASEKVFPP